MFPLANPKPEPVARRSGVGRRSPLPGPDQETFAIETIRKNFQARRHGCAKSGSILVVYKLPAGKPVNVGEARVAPAGLLPVSQLHHRPLRFTAASASRAFGVTIILCVASAGAQEAFRASLAGQDAVEAKKRALTNQRFNVKLGPVSLRLQAGLTTEATDNVRYTASDEQADLSFRPQLNTLAVWRATEKNTLSLSLGVGYAKYLNATEYDGLFIAPGSDLSFDVYVQDFVINFHDRFSFSQDVTGDPTVSGIGGLDRFENTVGVGVTWDLNKMLVTAGYDYSVYVPTADLYSYQSRGSHLFNASSALVINPTTLAGLQVFGGLTDYDEPIYSDNQHVGVGGFVSSQFSQYSRLRASVGYVNYFFDPSLSAPFSQTLNGIYLDASYNQRLNAYFSHSISLGRQLQAGYLSDGVELIYFRHAGVWRLFAKTTMTTTLSYEYFKEDRQQPEKGNRYGAGLGFSRPVTRKLTGSLRYAFYLKDSDVDARDYTQNRLVLDLIYRF